MSFISKITMRNKKVREDVVQEKEIIPNGFVNKQAIKKVVVKDKTFIRNGRVAKVLSDNKAMYCDNGETFDI